jgi:hypothetical protein
MKKLITAILAAALMSIGLVAAVEAPAQAACPYSACIATQTVAKHPKTISGTSITVKVRVKPLQGTGQPTGTVKVSVKKYNGTYFKAKTLTYTGGKLSFDFTSLAKKGKYRVLAKFIPAEGSVWKRSKSRTTFIKS